jgi:MFS family permease
MGWYYGWTVLGVAFVTTSVTLGTHAAFGVLLVALADGLGWGRSVIAGAIALTAVLWMLSSTPLGAAFDRWGPRWVYGGAALVAATGLAFAATTEAPWQLYLGMGVLAGIGMTPLRANAQSVVVTNWFVRRRGLAVGVVASGVGVGVLVVAPLTQWVIDQAGWRAAFLALAALYLVGLAPLNALWQRRRPEDLGLLPDGGRGAGAKGQMTGGGGQGAESARRPAAPPPGRGLAGPTVGLAVRHPRFWVLAVGFVLGALPLQFLLAHGVAYLVDRGFTPGLAASVLGVSGAATAGSMVLWGYVVDRWGGEAAYTAGSLALMASIGVLVAVGPGREPLLYVYAALFALGFASRQGVMTTLAAAILHGPAFGTLMGILAAHIALGSALGPYLGGWVFDHAGSYYPMFACSLVSAAVSLVCVWVAAPRHGRIGVAAVSEGRAEAATR